MFKRSLWCLLLALLLAIPLSAQSPPAFQPDACPILLPFGFSEGSAPGNIECGFVNVPEFHDNPAGNQIRVAIAIIHSDSPGALPDPIVMEQGGPGGSTFELFIPAADLLEQILRQRDVILVEQRGTLHSQPALTCPEILDTQIANISQAQSLDDFTGSGGAYDQCFRRLRAEGVNLSAYNSVENANDIIAVADALGYDEINFYGVSYGTMLGQHLLRDHESRLRSIIFDSVVPLEVNYLTDAVISSDDALRSIFTACATDFACNNRYPNLETTTFNTVNTLNATPVLIPIYNLDTGQQYEAFFNGDIMLQLLRSLQYQSGAIPSIPAFIDAAANGDFEWVERIYGITTFGDAPRFADAMHMSVICAEDGDFTAADIVTDGREEFINNSLLSATAYLQACALAQITPLGSYVDDPVISDVPALLITGQFDPVTPPRYATTLAQNLSNATTLVFPGIGHGAIFSGECPNTIISQFLFSPTVPPQTSCIEFMGTRFLEFTTDPTGRLQFTPPEDLLDISTGRYAQYSNEAGDLVVSVIAIENTDVDAAISEALQTVIRPGFSAPIAGEFYDYGYSGDAVTRFYEDGNLLVLVYATNLEDLSAVTVFVFDEFYFYDVDYYYATMVYNQYPVD